MVNQYNSNLYRKPFQRYGEISKAGHVTPLRPHLSNFAFFCLVPLVVNLLAKFEVYSSNHFQDIQGVPKFQH